MPDITLYIQPEDTGQKSISRPTELDMTNNSEDLTKIHIDLPNHWWFKGESLWAKDLGNNEYEIRNIPFCAYGLNFEDIVYATEDAPELKPEIRSVVSRSGNKTIRIFFLEQAGNREQQLQYLNKVTELGAWFERANGQVVCVNVSPTADYEAILIYLNKLEEIEMLEYETCEERVAGSFDDCPDDNDGNMSD